MEGEYPPRTPAPLWRPYDQLTPLEQARRRETIRKVKEGLAWAGGVALVTGLAWGVAKAVSRK